MKENWKSRLAVVLALAAVVITGCQLSEREAGPASPHAATRGPAVRLVSFGSYPCEDPAIASVGVPASMETSFNVVPGGALQVKYQVQNLTDDELFLANRLRVVNDFHIKADRYYLVPRQDGVIEISQRQYNSTNCPVVPQQPPIPPRLTRMGPHQTFTDEFFVKRPFTIDYAFAPAPLDMLPPMPDPATKVEFCLGVVKLEGKVAKPKSVHGEELYPYKGGDQQYLCSGVHTIE